MQHKITINIPVDAIGRFDTPEKLQEFLIDFGRRPILKTVSDSMKLEAVESDSLSLNSFIPPHQSMIRYEGQFTLISNEETKKAKNNLRDLLMEFGADFGARRRLHELLELFE